MRQYACRNGQRDRTTVTFHLHSFWVLSVRPCVREPQTAFPAEGPVQGCGAQKTDVSPEGLACRGKTKVPKAHADSRCFTEKFRGDGAMGMENAGDGGVDKRQPPCLAVEQGTESGEKTWQTSLHG